MTSSRSMRGTAAPCYTRKQSRCQIYLPNPACRMAHPAVFTPRKLRRGLACRIPRPGGAAHRRNPLFSKDVPGFRRAPILTKLSLASGQTAIAAAAGESGGSGHVPRRLPGCRVHLPRTTGAGSSRAGSMWLSTQGVAHHQVDVFFLDVSDSYLGRLQINARRIKPNAR